LGFWGRLLGAGWYAARRWWFLVKVAVVGASSTIWKRKIGNGYFLFFVPEDGSININFASKHTSIVDQIAG